jgi:HD-like signal output (HDOD) protein
MPRFSLSRPKKEPASSNSFSPLEHLKIKVGNVAQFPMMPEAANKALRIANDPYSSLQKLAKAIERDPVLATGILHLANSSLYRFGEPIQVLDHAIVRLGLRECQSLIVTVGLRSLHRSVPIHKRRHCEILWQHSFLTACLCRRLNLELGLGFTGEEFVSGLAHDIGRILIAIGVPSQFDEADPLDFVEGPSTLEQEQSVLGTDHCFFGAWFASINRLPPAVLNAIQFHHAPGETDSHRHLIRLVAAADHMANHVQRGQTGDTYDSRSNTGWKMLAQDWDNEVISRNVDLIPGVIAAASEEAAQVLSSTSL